MIKPYPPADASAIDYDATMQLPIVRQSSDDVMLTARRCRMDLSRAIAIEFTADDLFAFASTALPRLAAANCVELVAPLTSDGFDRISSQFAERGGRCVRWTSAIEDLQLVGRGAAVSEIAVMRLANWSRSSFQAEAMILQARAAAAKIYEWLSVRFGSDTAAIAAGLLHVDDPQDEWLIAIKRGRAVASAAVLISGEAGLIHDVHSINDESAEARVMMDRAIDFAARAGLRHVVACVDAADIALFRSAGFVQAGRLYEHVFNT